MSDVPDARGPESTVTSAATITAPHAPTIPATIVRRRRAAPSLASGRERTLDAGISFVPDPLPGSTTLCDATAGSGMFGSDSVGERRPEAFRSAMLISVASPKRAAGSFRIARSITDQISGASSGIGGTSRRRTASTVDANVDPSSKGFRPPTIM